MNAIEHVKSLGRTAKSIDALFPPDFLPMFVEGKEEDFGDMRSYACWKHYRDGKQFGDVYLCQCREIGMMLAAIGAWEWCERYDEKTPDALTIPSL